MAKEGDRSFKKRHVGLIGLLTILAQYGVGVKNEDATQKAFQAVVLAELKTQRAEIKVDQERHFVRKSDLAPVMERLTKKLDQVEGKIDRQGRKISRIEGYMKAATPLVSTR